MYATEPTVWYYVNNQAGTDLYGDDTTGNGSANFPWRTAAKAKAVLGTVNGAIGVRIAGEHPPLTWDDCTGLTLESWPNVGEGWFSARYAIAASAWTSLGSGKYSTNIGAGKTLGWDGLTVGAGTTGLRGSVVVNYENREDVNGHKGHYKWVSGAGAAGQWDYNNTTGVLTINLAAEDSDPRAQDNGYVCWVDTAVNCLQTLNSTRCTFRRLKFGPVAGSLGLSGLNYGHIYSGAGNVVEENDHVDCGYHGWGCVSGSNTNNLIRNNLVRGMVSHSTAASVTCGVVHSIASHSGNRCYGNLYVCHSWRYPDGTYIDTSTSITGLHTHTSGGAVVAFEAEKERAIYFTGGNVGEGFTGVDIEQSGVPSDNSAAELVANNYQARFTDCRIENGYTTGFIAGGALVRCTFLLTNTTAGPKITTSGFSGTYKMLMDTCYIAANLYATFGNERSIFLLQRNSGSGGGNGISRLVARNCTFVDVAEQFGSGTPYWPRLMTWTGSSDTGSVRFIGCVFMGSSGKGLTLSVNESSVVDATSAFTFDRCWYYQIDAAAWLYGNAALDTEAEFKPAKDPNGVYSVNPNFANVLTGPTPTATGNLATTRYVNANRPTIGINGRLYNGRYGAWQDGVAQSPFFELLQAFLTQEAA